MFNLFDSDNEPVKNKLDYFLLCTLNDVLNLYDATKYQKRYILKVLVYQYLIVRYFFILLVLDAIALLDYNFSNLLNQINCC